MIFDSSRKISRMSASHKQSGGEQRVADKLGRKKKRVQMGGVTSDDEEGEKGIEKHKQRNEMEASSGPD